MFQKVVSPAPAGVIQSEVLMEIEGFVKVIIERGGLYMPHWDAFKRRMFCERATREIPRLLRFYAPDHEYSEHIEAFWHACEKQGWLDCGEPTWMVAQMGLPSTDASDVMESFADFILDFTRSLRFRRRQSDRCYEQQRKREGLEVYTRTILARNARTLVLRADLKYFKDRPVTIAEVYAHIDELLARIRRRLGVFQNMLGYAICVEQGGEHGGYHLHLAVLLPGHLHQRDGFLVRQIGLQWGEITAGRGTFHSCNARKAVFERLGLRGVGMFHRSDELGCDNVVQVVGYLAEHEKEDQYLRMKPIGRRTYFTGE